MDGFGDALLGTLLLARLPSQPPEARCVEFSPNFWGVLIMEKEVFNSQFSWEFNGILMGF
jgi:hypothetical protein